MRGRILAVLAILVMPAAAQQPSPRELFERARLLEESGRNLDDAIALYTQVASQAAENGQRELAATAQFRVGLLQERLGRTDEAQRALRIVVTQYADQREVMSRAQARLAGAGSSAQSTLAVRRIWTGPDVEIGGSVSRDGRYLSFVDIHNGGLALREIATGAMRPLVTDTDWTGFVIASVISPDGRQVAYSRFGNLAPQSKEWIWDLRLVGTDGSGARILYHNQDVEFLWPQAWSPDGKSIATILSRQDRTNQIALVSAADGSARVLKTFDWRFPNHLRFSPDGRYLAYDFPPREESSRRDIYLVGVDGSREVPLVAGSGNNAVLGWTPAGAALLFETDRTGSHDAWIVEVADGAPRGERLVKRDIGPVWPLGFTRTGQFYYGAVTGMQDVYVTSLDRSRDGGPVRIARRFIGSNVDPAWSPDGRRLAYISNRNRTPIGAVTGDPVLVIRDLETGDERDLRPQLPYFAQPRWSPDGRTLLVHGRDLKGRGGLYLINAQTGMPTLVAYAESPYDPAWFPDGHAIAYRNVDRLGNQLLVRDLDTGVEREVHRGNVKGVTVSPDGRRIAFAETDAISKATVLKTLAVLGGPAEVVFSYAYTGPVWLAWTSDSAHLVFNRGDDLYRIPATGGEAIPLGISMRGVGALQVAPDGRRIAFTAGEAAAEVWVMENFLPAAPVNRR